MEYEELVKRINRVTRSMVMDMSSGSMKMLTDDFSEPLVRLLVSRGSTVSAQSSYWYYVKYDWEHLYLGRRLKPDYFKSIDFDLECGVLIKAPDIIAPPDSTEPPVTVADVAKAILSQGGAAKPAADPELKAENQRLTQRVKSLEAERERLKRELKEAERSAKKTEWEEKYATLKSRYDDCLAELLAPCFYKDRAAAASFLAKAATLDDVGIAQMVVDMCDRGEIAQSLKGTPMWRVLHAAGYYTSTDRNWSTYLRTH